MYYLFIYIYISIFYHSLFFLLLIFYFYFYFIFILFYFYFILFLFYCFAKLILASSIVRACYKVSPFSSAAHIPKMEYGVMMPSHMPRHHQTPPVELKVLGEMRERERGRRRRRVVTKRREEGQW